MRCLTITISAVLALGACTTESVVNAAYPDRARFQFVNADQDTVLFYACENGPTGQETETRAKAAHRFIDANIAAAAELSAARMIEGIEAGESALAIGFDISRRMDAQMEVVVEEAEARFQCVMYKTQDV